LAYAHSCCGFAFRIACFGFGQTGWSDGHPASMARLPLKSLLTAPPVSDIQSSTRFFIRRVDRSNNELPVLVHRDLLHRHLFLPARAIAFQRLHLGKFLIKPVFNLLCLPASFSPSGCTGVLFRAEPALSVFCSDTGCRIVFLAGYMINSFAGIDAHIALDPARRKAFGC